MNCFFKFAFAFFVCVALFCSAQTVNVTVKGNSGLRTLKSRELIELQKDIAELDKTNFERTQTFGRHFDMAKEAAEKAAVFLNGNPADYDAVQKELDKAKAELAWLEANEKSRADYLGKTRQILDILLELCDQLGVAITDQTVSSVTSVLKKATEPFENGDMKGALKFLEDAEEAVGKLVDAQIMKTLERAEEHCNKGEYADALEVLKNGRKLKADHPQLNKKLAEVRKFTVTTLKVIAMFNGAEVPAMVNVDGEWETMPFNKDVPKGSKVKLRVVYAQGTLNYGVATGEYSCDWLGEKQFFIELQPVAGPQLRKNWSVEFGANGEGAMDFVFVRGGTFKMGRSLNDQSGEIQHDVELRNGYWLGAKEVTQRQWSTLMEKNPSFDQTSLDNPVENISWDDAMLFCRKLTNREHLAGRLPEGYVFTLPTEAQWEFACRANSTGAYSFGDDDLVLPLYGNVMGTEDGFAKVAPAGHFRANAWGFFDMHGNVSEWCRDLYGTYPENKVVEPAGPAEAEPLRIHRGGSWNQAASNACSYARDFATPSFHDECIGFRIALAKTK
ncbi:MAG: SUMF1/EgtB/PvdO family nonheme iron enzyme [Victivallales bacterium]|nr:SUMF1/EgtB/PvdO family nonheme iron enzyme [Victivallales bacterium]